MRYIVMGGCIFLLDLGVFLMFDFLGLDIRIAQGISRSTGAVSGFFIHKYITFQNNKSDIPSFLMQGSAYGVSTVAFILVSPFIVYFFVQLFNRNLIVAKIVAELCMVVVIYGILNIIFRCSKKESIPDTR
ncbi:MAG: GtrA family protein [candidate division WOR-3 bacterium]|nr:MAG: GtrA family protein [candidate division WOR-3 bacterium]